jgi:hypothetical protein
MKKTLTILLTCSFFFGCIEYSSGQYLFEQQKLSIEKQVDSVFHIMVKAAESIAYDKLSAGVDDKYNAGFIVNGSYYAKFDSLLNTIKERSQGVNSQRITIQKEKIAVLSESIALVTAYGDTKVEVSNGNTFDAKFFWSFVYQKINGQWKVIQSHQSGVR